MKNLTAIDFKNTVYYVIERRCGSWSGYITDRKSGNFSATSSNAKKWKTRKGAESYLEKNGSAQCKILVKVNSVWYDCLSDHKKKIVDLFISQQ